MEEGDGGNSSSSGNCLLLQFIQQRRRHRPSALSTASETLLQINPPLTPSTRVIECVNYIVILSSGTELYQERLVKALAQGLQVPVLVFNSTILAPYQDLDDDSGKEGSLESENKDHGDSSKKEECTSSTGSESDASSSDDDYSGEEECTTVYQYRCRVRC